jgi:cytochrome c biogenesis protein CcmG, thiol:disulfide interchange protein DsbE
VDRKKLTLLLIFAAAAVFFFFAFAEKKNEQVITENFYMPLLDLRDEGTGQKLSAEEVMGKVLFVNFWASWCPPCKEEMPSIESLSREMSGNGNFKMITVLYKDTYSDGVGYVKQHGYTFPVYSDDRGAAARTFGVTGVPETYLIDKNGQIRKRVLGPAEWDSPEAKDLINSLLNE